VWFDEYSTLDTPASVSSAVLGDGEAEGWADGLVADGAEILAQYTSGIYAGQPTITTQAVASGRITYVGTHPGLGLATSLLRWAVPQTRASEWTTDATITVTSGQSSSGRVWFVHNWSPDTGRATAPSELGGTEIVLDAWDVRVLVEQRDPESGVVSLHTPERVEK
jgi:beta-galactosidase